MKLKIFSIVGLVVLFLAGCSSSDSTFRIEDVSGPRRIVRNSEPDVFTIRWSGNPTFPTEIVVGKSVCTFGSCEDESLDIPVRVNPIPFTYQCIGTSVFSELTNVLSIRLIDADGTTTNAVEISVTCVE